MADDPDRTRRDPGGLTGAGGGGDFLDEPGAVRREPALPADPDDPLAGRGDPLLREVGPVGAAGGVPADREDTDEIVVRADREDDDVVVRDPDRVADRPDRLRGDLTAGLTDVVVGPDFGEEDRRHGPDEQELLPETERHRRYSEGQEYAGETEEKEREGDFATGQRVLGDDDEERYSTGQEELGETAEKEREGSFATGQEQLDDDLDDPDGTTRRR